jgi:hypothetical protein
MRQEKEGSQREREREREREKIKYLAVGLNQCICTSIWTSLIAVNVLTAMFRWKKTNTKIAGEMISAHFLPHVKLISPRLVNFRGLVSSEMMQLVHRDVCGLGSAVSLT